MECYGVAVSRPLSPPGGRLWPTGAALAESSVSTAPPPPPHTPPSTGVLDSLLSIYAKCRADLPIPSTGTLELSHGHLLPAGLHPPPTVSLSPPLFFQPQAQDILLGKLGALVR